MKNKFPNQAVILCGGRGKRLGPFTLKSPKPMFLTFKKPFLEYLINILKNRGLKKILLLTGYKSEIISNYFKNGDSLGVKIRYHKGLVNWETAKRIYKASNLLDKEFYLFYSDNFINFFPERLFEFYKKNYKPLSITIFRKKFGNIYFNQKKLNYFYSSKKSNKNKYVELGFMLVNKKFLFSYLDDSNINLSRIINKISNEEKISYYKHYDQYYSISDLDRANITGQYLSSKKILLLDRDGIINYKAPKGEYITTWKKFVFIKENILALEKLSSEGFKFIIISNQAGVSRNKLSLSKLAFINKKMSEFLKKRNIKIINIFVCVHHWKDNCYCRKPKPGMFFSSSKKYKFRLDKVLYVGDDKRDCEASYNAGCKSIFIGNKKSLINFDNKMKPNKIFKNLSNAYKYIINFYAN